MEEKETLLKRFDGIYPVKMSMRKEALDGLLAMFDQNAIYQEKQINEIISRFFPGDQYCEIRRDLVGLGYMERNPENKTYWLCKKK